MDYFIFMDHRLARRNSKMEFEWLLEGEWKKDSKKSLALLDAMNGFGDFSIGDQDQIKDELAEELIKNGTVILHGDIGYGTFYKEPKTIKLSDWKSILSSDQ